MKHRHWNTRDKDGKLITIDFTDEQLTGDATVLAHFNTLETAVALDGDPNHEEHATSRTVIADILPTLPPLRAAHWNGELKRIGAKLPIKKIEPVKEEPKIEPVKKTEK